MSSKYGKDSEPGFWFGSDSEGAGGFAAMIVSFGCCVWSGSDEGGFFIYTVFGLMSFDEKEIVLTKGLKITVVINNLVVF